MDLIDETLINKTSNGSSRIDGKIPKTAPVTYRSQISGDKNAIKIRIRKSNTDFGVEKKRRRSNKKTKNRSKGGDDDDDDNDNNDSNNNANSDASSSTNSLGGGSGGTQSTYNNSKAAVSLNQEKGRWADGLPFAILRTIFQYVCQQSNGAVPNLVRFSGVCRFWREVSQEPKLWKIVELSPYTKQKFMSDQTLHWILANRLSECEELNLNDWKALNITEIVFLIKEYCPDLKSIGLSGWINLTAEQLKLLVTGCTKLRKLDLSSINHTKINAKTAVSLSPLISLVEIMGDRLTNLILSNNKLTGLPQIVAAISNHCCNLELLDLSNIKPHSHTIPSIDLEKLQEGCRKLRVLRITNSQIILASSLLSQQAASPGFPMLEELSLAGVEEYQTTSKFIDDNGLDRILKSSQKLRLLDVRGCTKITGSGLVRVPAWDIQHLFLSASSITRCDYMGLGLVVQKWSHSLVEIDLAWASSCDLDPSIISLSEAVQNPPLRKIDLCGSSVSAEPIKKLLQNCHQLQSINLQSCRGLPRGVKRLFQNQDLVELKNVLNKSEFESTETTDNDD